MLSSVRPWRLSYRLRITSPIQTWGLVPARPHSPPYTTEIEDNLAILGYHQGTHFQKDEFSNGMGVWLVWINIPARETIGSSPDFTSGPIIPNSLFPIHVKGILSAITHCTTPTF